MGDEISNKEWARMYHGKHELDPTNNFQPTDPECDLCKND